MRVIRAVGEMRQLAEEIRSAGRRLALVPTMGWFHEGHLSLMREARRRADVVVVSVFVNPIQFGPREDYDRYPRDLERDRRLAEGVGVDVLFAPSVEEMYPRGYQTFVEVAELSRPLCGQARPGHFRGVATVVLKLFNIVRPHLAIFGQKDYQQLLIVRRMVEDLNLDVEVVGMPTVREPDGLAASSRNSYLSPAERRAALSIPRALQRAQRLYQEGTREARPLLKEVRRTIEAEDLTEIEYVRLCDPQTLQEVERVDRQALLALAVWVGTTRLIDHVILGGEGPCSG